MSTLPSASRFFKPGGVLGLFVMKGSMTMTLPVRVVIFVVACPSQWTSILVDCAHAGSAARLTVRAPAVSLRKSRRSMSMGLLPTSGGLDGVAGADDAVVEDLRAQPGA